MKLAPFVALGLLALPAAAAAENIVGAYQCKHSGTAVCGEICTGAGTIERDPVKLQFDTKGGLISLEGLRGSITERSANHYSVIWGFDLGKPTELALRGDLPVGVMAILRSPDRENEFICKRRR